MNQSIIVLPLLVNLKVYILQHLLCCNKITLEEVGKEGIAVYSFFTLIAFSR